MLKMDAVCVVDMLHMLCLAGGPKILITRESDGKPGHQDSDDRRDGG